MLNSAKNSTIYLKFLICVTLSTSETISSSLVIFPFKFISNSLVELDFSASTILLKMLLEGMISLIDNKGFRQTPKTIFTCSLTKIQIILYSLRNYLRLIEGDLNGSFTTFVLCKNGSASSILGDEILQFNFRL